MRHENSKKPLLPRGVSWDRNHRGSKKFKTRVFFNGKDRFIGRFETVDEASAAYQQAAACFRCSPAEVDDPAFLQRVRTHIANPAANEPFQSEQSPPASSQTEGAEVTTKVHDVEFGTAQGPLQRQQSIPSSQQSASAGPVQEMQYEGASTAPSMAVGTSCFTAAGELQPYGSCQTSGLQHLPDAAASCQSLSDHELEAVMTHEVLRVMGLLHEGPEQQQLEQQQHTMSLQQSQQQLQQGMRPSISCTSLPDAAFVAGALQRPRSCAPILAAQGTTAAAAGAFAASSPTFSAGFAPTQQPQQLKREVQSQADLQQLLHTALQDAGQLDVADAAADLLQCDEYGTCCNEFLAATSAAAAAAATPSLSAPAGACAMQPNGTHQQQAHPCYSTPAGPAAPTTSGAAAGATAATVAQALSEPCAELPPAGLIRQDSLLMQSTSCLDAVLYIAAVVRAVLDLYTTMLHKVFEQDDAAADLLTWLSTFRQQQQCYGPAAIAAATGSPTAAGHLEALQGCVMDVLGKVVRLLLTPCTAGAQQAAGVSSSKAGSPIGRSAVVGGMVPSSAPLAKRTFVISVLERLNICLVKLHGVLQQRQNGTVGPAELWQEVQQWLQQLQAQATTPEDRMAVQLASLL